MFRWLKNRISPETVEPEVQPVLVEDTSGDLAEAREERTEAERKLDKDRQLGREVSSVTALVRRLRTENNFSARMREIYGRPSNG